VTNSEDHPDFYHDDPVSEESSIVSKKLSGFLALLLLAVGGFYLQSTLAANITVSSGRGIEFGQAQSQLVACSGDTNLILTPSSKFINVVGTGAHYLNSVTVSEIPSTCDGKDFSIMAYGDSDSTPLPIFYTSSTEALIYNNAGVFSASYSATTVASSTGKFTVTFNAPAATSLSIKKIVLQSKIHVPKTCAQGGNCAVDETGPGGGKVFFVSAGFASVGSQCSTFCKYLEVAPSGWGTSPVNFGGYYDFSYSDDPAFPWDTRYPTYGILNGGASGEKVGTGFANSEAIRLNNSAGVSNAATIARRYAGAGLTDWYLPAVKEVVVLCRFVQGLTSTTGNELCDPSTSRTRSGYSNKNSGGYWSSTEVNDVSSAYYVYMPFGTGKTLAPRDVVKYSQSFIRPIRAM
jgi:hypothetical protein